MEISELHLLDKLIQNNKEENPNPEGKNLVGLSDLVSSMYADKSHFVYELIQNADDAEACSVEFYLHDNYLIFVHNGKRKFSITDPYQDLQNQDIGDLNAISWISRSVKINEPNKIGKFGIGFYSVYKYVKEVFLKEDPFFVRLHHITLLDDCKNDEEWIKSKFNYNDIDLTNKTMFILPFKGDLLNEAYKEIYEKLNSLNKPTIFLNHLKNIKIKFYIDDSSLFYSVICLKKGKYNIENQDYLWDLISYRKTNAEIEYYYKISSILPNTKHYSSVLFKTDSNGSKITEQESELFCYFSLDLPIQYKFIIHAPFQTTSGRNALVVNRNDYNQILLKELAEFFAMSIVVLARLKAYRNDLENIYPDDCTYFLKKIGEMVFPVFRNVFSKRLADKEFIPTEGHEYERADNLVYLKDSKLRKLFSAELLHELGISKKVAFPDVGQKQSNVIYNIVSDFKIQIIDDEAISKYLNPRFMDNVDKDWLKKFYEYLFESKGRFSEYFLDKKIFRTSDGKWSSFLNNNGAVQIYKSNENCNYLILDKNFYSEEVLDFLENKLQLIDPDDITLLQEEKERGQISADDFFIKSYRLFLKYRNNNDEKDRLLSVVNGCAFIRDENGKYLAPKNLIACFSENQRLRFVEACKYDSYFHDYSIIDYVFYKNKLGCEFNFDLFKRFLNALNINFVNFRRKTILTTCIPESFKVRHPDIKFFCFGGRYTYLHDYSPTSLTLTLINCSFIDERISKLAFDCILDILNDDPDADLSKYFYSESGWGKFDGQAEIIKESMLLYFPFLLKKDGKYSAPIERVKLSELSDIYNISQISSNNLEKLLNFLMIENDYNEEIINGIKKIGFFEMMKLTNLILQKNISISSLTKLLETDYPKIKDSIFEVPDKIKDNLEYIESKGALKLDLTSNNESALSRQDRIVAMLNAADLAIEVLQKLGYEIKSKEHIKDGVLTIEKDYGAELFVQCKSSIKHKKIQLTSYDIENIIKYKSSFRLFILISSQPVKFSKLLSIKDIFQSSENLSITLSGIKDYLNDDLQKFIFSLQYCKGFSLDIGHIIDNITPSGLEIETENMPLNELQDSNEDI